MEDRYGGVAKQPDHGFRYLHGSTYTHLQGCAGMGHTDCPDDLDRKWSDGNGHRHVYPADRLAQRDHHPTGSHHRGKSVEAGYRGVEEQRGEPYGYSRGITYPDLQGGRGVVHSCRAIGYDLQQPDEHRHGYLCAACGLFNRDDHACRSRELRGPVEGGCGGVAIQRGDGSQSAGRKPCGDIQGDHRLDRPFSTERHHPKQRDHYSHRKLLP